MGGKPLCKVEVGAEFSVFKTEEENKIILFLNIKGQMMVLPLIIRKNSNINWMIGEYLRF